MIFASASQGYMLSVVAFNLGPNIMPVSRLNARHTQTFAEERLSTSATGVIVLHRREHHTTAVRVNYSDVYQWHGESCIEEYLEDVISKLSSASCLSMVAGPGYKGQRGEDGDVDANSLASKAVNSNRNKVYTLIHSSQS